jgi:hypothetical protein
MVLLPQELVPTSVSTEITAIPPVDVSTIPPVEVTVTGQPIKTEAYPIAGLKRLYGPAQPDFEADSPRNDLLYTVPSSPPMRAVLYTIVFVNNSNTSSWITIGVNGVLDADLLLHQYAITANSFNIISFPVGVPLAAGETIKGFQQHSGDNTVTLIGVELPA